MQWSEEETNKQVGNRLKQFDKQFSKKYKLWETSANPDKKINLANAEKHLTPAVAEIRKSDAARWEDKVLRKWVEEFIQLNLIPMVQEGVFVNEGLNHLRQFLLARGGKIQHGTEGITPFKRDIDNDTVQYAPELYVEPSATVRLKLEGGVFRTEKTPDRVPHIKSSVCALEWDESCDGIFVDGFTLDTYRTDELKLNKPETISIQDIERGELAKVDLVLLLSMLNYFDHPEFFQTLVGKIDTNKLPTRFIMLAAIRREHPLQNSVPMSNSNINMDAKTYKDLKLNICRGTEATLKFTASLNPLSDEDLEVNDKTKGWSWGIGKNTWKTYGDLRNAVESA